MNESLSEHDRLQAAIKAQQQNVKRNQLMGAINEITGQYGLTTDKTYNKESK